MALPNRILQEDKITSKLQKYGAGIGVAANDDAHRTRIKEVLEHFDHHDEFYLEMDLRSGYITWAYGLKKWLRHEDPEIGKSRNDFLVQYVHPFIADWYHLYLGAMMKILTERATEYLMTRFCITVPLKDADGHYHLVRQMGIVFGKDSDGRLASIINSLFIVGPYHGEALKAELYKSNENIQDQVTDRLLELIYPCMEVDREKSKAVTFQDIFFIDLILEVIHNGHPRNYKSVKAAYDNKKKKGIGVDTVKKRLSRLKLRLERLLYLDKPPDEYKAGNNGKYLPHFKDIFGLVDFMDQSGIIMQLKNYFLVRKNRS